MVLKFKTFEVQKLNSHTTPICSAYLVGTGTNFPKMAELDLDTSQAFPSKEVLV